MLNLLYLQNTLRVHENTDWVIWVLLGCIVLFLIVIISLQRDSTIKGFLLQKEDEANNVFPSWLLISLAFCLVFATLVAPYIPFIPQFIAERTFLGFELNKFGFVFFAMLIFYSLKTIFTFFFFQVIGHGKSYETLYFVSAKYYLVISIILIAVTFVNYFVPIDPEKAFHYYIGFFFIAFIFKVFYFLFNKNKIFEFEWYYKFLYICTLQIAPFLALWKLLFI